MKLWRNVKEWWARFRGRRVRLVIDAETDVEPERMRSVNLHRGDTLIIQVSPQEEDNSITLDWPDGDSYTLTFDKPEAE